MKCTLWSVLILTSLTASAGLPSVLRAQQQGIPITLGANGSISIPSEVLDRIAGQGGDAQAKSTVDPVQRIIAREAGDGKHAVVVVDSVRASEDDLVKLSQALRSGTLRVKEGGVRTVAGDSPEAKQYGAKADEKVILISTEPGTAAPADSGKAKP